MTSPTSTIETAASTTEIFVHRQLTQHRSQRISRAALLPVCATALLLASCGGGSSNTNSSLTNETQLADGSNPASDVEGADNATGDNEAGSQSDDTDSGDTGSSVADAGDSDTDSPDSGDSTDGGDSETVSPAPILEDAPLEPLSATATYRVTVRSFWSAEDYPQEFPSDAHFSFWGGAVHNADFSMWDFGTAPSTGMEDMAETGRIDILLFDEVVPAIESGTAHSTIDYRTYTGPAIGDEPGVVEFDIEVTQSHPLTSMVSMLGPSPDWFVGVDSLSLQAESTSGSSEWLESLIVPMPLYDGGSKTGMVPVMGGPDIIPPDPVSLLTYDSATGTYSATDVEHIIGELEFTRIE